MGTVYARNHSTQISRGSSHRRRAIALDTGWRKEHVEGDVHRFRTWYTDRGMKSMGAPDGNGDYGCS